ncbi:hypothetical protein L345_01446, partial [Ophiophagus hannah]
MHREGRLPFVAARAGREDGGSSGPGRAGLFGARWGGAERAARPPRTRIQPPRGCGAASRAVLRARTHSIHAGAQGLIRLPCPSFAGGGASPSAVRYPDSAGGFWYQENAQLGSVAHLPNGQVYRTVELDGTLESGVLPGQMVVQPFHKNFQRLCTHSSWRQTRFIDVRFLPPTALNYKDSDLLQPVWAKLAL